MSGAAAAIGTVLGICPIMRLDDKGRIIAYDKVRGKKNAVARTVETMKRHAENGENYSGKAFICHSNCLADAKATKAAVEAAFPHLNGEVRICDIGTIVASHSGRFARLTFSKMLPRLSSQESRGSFFIPPLPVTFYLSEYRSPVRGC